MTSWMYILLAGVCEIVWTMALKLCNGFTEPKATAVTFISMMLSTYFLAVATEEIPLGVAYAVWVGIGVVGTVIGSALFFGESITLIHVLFLLMILGGIIGLKITGACT